MSVGEGEKKTVTWSDTFFRKRLESVERFECNFIASGDTNVKKKPKKNETRNY